ncbi:hypothetical protein [Streptomyces phaeochromogenes]|uniref:hypothetical protein n=1 Tax=Streptomyces phaeochromogenes TaxID=1923 RepID=UPI0033FBAED4
MPAARMVAAADPVGQDGGDALAHEVSPVRLTLTTRLEAMDAGLTAALTRTLGYAIAEEVELPPEAVASLTIDGPEWLSKTVSDVRVTWQPVPDAAPSDAAAEVEFLNSEGVTCRSCATWAFSVVSP